MVSAVSIAQVSSVSVSTWVGDGHGGGTLHVLERRSRINSEKMAYHSIHISPNLLHFSPWLEEGARGSA